MAENVRVVVRCRPMNEQELYLKCKNIIKIEGCSLNVENPNDKNAPSKAFTFDNAYDGLASTETLYNDVCYSLVDNVLEGYNGTIFAYGQTGCGKTHTMQGENLNDLSTGRGVITRALEHIFEAISVANDVRYLALVSYLEIYNENIRDLLANNETLSISHALKEVAGLGVTVPTLSTHTVLSAQDCFELLKIGNQNRVVGATLMNAQSSRSHSIFTISLEQIPNTNDTENILDTSASLGIRRGKLNLVDLAGSERQNKTGAIGNRLKEATKINLSLSALGNVISALVDGKSKHIPYRDSKLTRLLQDSLGGNTKTLMISCISPAENNYDETLSTLRYASRAKSISNKPIINEDPKDAKLREYQEEIIKLKNMLNGSQKVNVNSAVFDSVDPAWNESVREAWVERERLKLKEELENEIQILKMNHEQHVKEKDEHLREIESLRKHYEEKITHLSSEKITNDMRQTPKLSNDNDLQFEASKRIDLLKKALIGGERANDIQLKEFRQRKRIDAQRRLSALAHALSRVEQSEDRDLLQVHYTNIHQELNAKNEYIKRYRQKVKSLEREVSDLQSEFQIDRADYLETIRRMERNMKFYQQLLDKTLPILRKNGKYWDPEEIIQNSVWNDDLKTWKLPEQSMNTLKFPPANITRPRINANTLKLGTSRNSTPENENTQMNFDKNKLMEENPISYDANGQFKTGSNVETDILNNYFRSNRSRVLVHKHKLSDTNRIIYTKDYVLNSISSNNHLNIHIPVLDSADNSPKKHQIQNSEHRSDFHIPGSVFSRTWGGGIKRVLTATPITSDRKCISNTHLIDIPKIGL